LRVAQDVVLGRDSRDEPVPQERLIVAQDDSPGALGLRRMGENTQDYILGYFQASLRDCSLAHANPGLTSWATLSRPCGTGS